MGTEDLIFQSVEETQEDNQIVNERLEDHVPLRFLLAVALATVLPPLVLFLWPPITGYTCFHDIAKFQDFLYFVVVSASTVGYGDIVPTPRCVQGRVMTIFLMLAGSMIMITVLSEFLEMMDRKRAAFRKDLAKERHKETGLYEIKRLLG